jgi:predicted flap endonuclease-1-like 5' DNA nuclease
MSGFLCCFWWFILGILIGWLLNWLLRSWLIDDSSAGSGPSSFAQANATSQGLMDSPSMPSGLNLAAAAAAGFAVKGEHDIIIIEGIGPKIKELFNADGIHTFAQVAQLSVPQMQAILEKGGPRFKLANPGSWAQQARLAANNEWAALKKLQDELDAGVDRGMDGSSGSGSNNTPQA